MKYETRTSLKIETQVKQKKEIEIFNDKTPTVELKAQGKEDKYTWS